MRVLALSNLYPPHAYGGYELLCDDAVTRFRARGHHVEVLTTTWRVDGVEDPAAERASGVRRDLEFYWDDHELVRPAIRRRYEIERANRAALLRALDEVKPDVVSLWNMGAMSLGLIDTIVRRGVPIVYVMFDDWLFYAPHLDAWMRLFQGRWRRPLSVAVSRLTGLPTRLPDLDTTGAFCFTSEHTRKVALAKTAWRFPRSTIIYGGIDTDDFPLVAERADDGFAWRLLYVGRIDIRKGIETLLRAMPLLPDNATASVVGTGDNSELARLGALAAELGVAERVSFGSAPRRELRDVYAAADVCVFPSTWAEPFGVVPLEAMAVGTLVLGTGRGGSGEFLIDEYNCLRFPAGDHEALASQLHRLAAERDLRGRLRRGGLTTAAELTVDRLADVLEEWHRAAAESFANGAPHDRPLQFTVAAAETTTRRRE